MVKEEEEDEEEEVVEEEVEEEEEVEDGNKWSGNKRRMRQLFMVPNYHNCITQ